MSENRHNITSRDGADMPFADDASATDLGRVLEMLGAIGPELTADVVTEELRLAQYQRARALARWVIGASSSLIEGLEGEIKSRGGNA
jgi:hypothetical protein